LFIKEFNLLEKIFYLKNKEEEETKEFSNKDWLTSKGFERLSLLLNSTTYGNFALSGFVLSAGKLRKFLKNFSTFEFLEFSEKFLEKIFTKFFFLENFRNSGNLEH